MKKHLLIAIFLLIPVFALADVVPGGESFLQPLQKRDSVVVGDQFRYGFIIKDSPAGASYALPDLSKGIGEGLEVVQGWTADTLLTRAQRKTLRKGGEVPIEISVSMVVAPFAEGQMMLPPLPLQRTLPAGDTVVVDTLVFDPQLLDVRPIAIDTAGFVIRDIKPQVRYPLQASEVLPWIAGIDLAALIVGLVVCLIIIRRRKEDAQVAKDPAYIVALRGLEKYRGDKFWAPERQKTMYSGITDTLRTYIEDRFGINAEEMTTAEIFAALKGDPGLDEALYGSAKELFELSDFVKFAKHTASDEENSAAIPTAVRFVTSTYQAELEQEAGKEAGDE